MVEAALRRLRVASRGWRDRGVEARLRLCTRCAELLAASHDALTTALIADGGSRDVEVESGLASITPARLAVYARMMTAVAAGAGEILHARPDGVVVLSAPSRAPSVGLIPLLELLLVGNCVLFRSSRESAVVRLVLEIVERASAEQGIPSGLVEAVVASARHTLAEAIPSPFSDTILFYGGTDAGRSVAELALRHDKKLFLELEAIDSVVVWADGDVAAAARSIAHAFDYSGYPCIAPRRVLAHPAVAPALVAALAAEANGRRAPVRDGAGFNVPMPHAAAVALLERYATYTTLVHGGAIVEHDGITHLEPTIVTGDLSGFADAWPAWFDVEQLGPVVSILAGGGSDPLESIAAVLERSQFQNRVTVWTHTHAVRARLLAATAATGLVGFNCAHTANPVIGGFSGGKRRTGGASGETALFWRKTSMLQTLRCAGEVDAVLEALGATAWFHTLDG